MSPFPVPDRRIYHGEHRTIQTRLADRDAVVTMQIRFSVERAMGNRIEFFKTTIIGGVVFLVPFIVIVAIVVKAFALMKQAAQPLSSIVPVESVGDVAVVDLVLTFASS
jgi:hypothetical protein